MSLFAELKRRNVFRVGIAYAVAAWVLLQVFDVIGEILELPAWGGKLILAMIVIGFFIALIVAWAYELTPEGVKRESEVDRSQSVTAKTGRKLNALIIGLLLIAVAYLLVDKFWLQPRLLAPGDSAPQVAAQAGANAEKPKAVTDTGPSIAVLPFVNMSSDPDNAYFSDGLTETLLHMLAQLPGLRVAARTSSFSFKGKDVSIGEIADELNVAHVLEGSVQKASGQVRITAQLIRADDGFHVWSQSYTRPLEDIFTIQDEIATEVVKALDASLVGGVDSEALGPATRSVDAYEVYLRALEQQSVFSYASLATAEGLFKRALALDPGFVDARLGLARNYLLMHETGLLELDETRNRVNPLLAQVRETHENHPQARAYELILNTVWPVVLTEMTLAERRAALVELRGLLATVADDFLVRWRVAEMLEFIENDEQAALEVLQGGLLVDPRSAFLYARIGDRLREMDRLEEAQAALDRALELDPRQPGIYPRLARLAAARNDFPGRLKWMRRAVESDPEDHELATALARLFYAIGLTEEGDVWARRVAALVPDSDFVRGLAVARAESRQDWSEVMALSGAMIEHRATQREGVFNQAVGAYADAAVRLGRAREAYDFLLSVEPEAGEFDEPVTDMAVMDLRMYALLLMREFGDPERVIAAWEQAASQLQGFGWDWREEPGLRVFDHVIRGEYEAAVPDALEGLSTPFAAAPNRVLYFELPANAPIARFPEVAARLAELKRERQAARAAVSEMLREPEWQ